MNGVSAVLIVKNGEAAMLAAYQIGFLVLQWNLCHLEVRCDAQKLTGCYPIFPKMK